MWFLVLANSVVTGVRRKLIDRKFAPALTKAGDMGYMWPKYGKNMGQTMVNIWYFYGLDMGYCLPYQTHTWSLFLLR